MTQERSELRLNLPWDVLDACNGLGIDIGGSVMKVVYIHKDDWKEPKDRSSEKGTLRLVNFSREELQLSYPYIKERAYIKRKMNEKPSIYTTGVGGAQFMMNIQEELSLKTEILTEIDAFIQSFIYTLKELPSSELVTKIDEDVVKEVKHKSSMFETMMEDMKKKANSGMALPEQTHIEIEMGKEFPEGHYFMEEKDMFPSLIIMCGSAGGVMKVEKDGTFQSVEMIRQCGRLFLGLGCLLTGAKSFAELMDLAEKGDGNAVHQTWADLQKDIPKEDDSLYSTAKDQEDGSTDWPVFFFGKAVGKTLDEFKPEDVANGLLRVMATDLAQMAHLCSLQYPTKYVFFCGNYVAHPYMQKVLAEEWGLRDSQHAIMTGGKMKSIQFLTYGAFYGALGSLLNHKLKYTDKLAETQAKSSAKFAAQNEDKSKEQ